MGSIYRRTVKALDPATGQPTIDAETGKAKWIEAGPYWIKYYRNGRPFRESTATWDKGEARRKLKQREGEVAEGRFHGLRVQRIKFEELADDLRANYVINKKKTMRRLNELLAHLGSAFRGYRAVEITSNHIQAYIVERQAHGAANGTINRELGVLKRMFSLAREHTPPKVSQVPYIQQLKASNIRSGFFGHEDFLALRGALPDYAQVAVTLAYYSGMRMGEVCSLQWQQVNLAEGKLYLKAQDTKTETPRVPCISLVTSYASWRSGSCAVGRNGHNANGSAIVEAYHSRVSSVLGGRPVSASGLAGWWKIKRQAGRSGRARFRTTSGARPSGTWCERVCLRRWRWRSQGIKLGRSLTATTS